MNRIFIPTAATFFLLFRIVFCTAGIVQEGESSEVKSDQTPPKLAVLKLDDVVVGGKERIVTDRWQRVADFLEGKKIKSSMGIIGYSLVEDNPAYFKWITDRAERGYIEFWNHGFHRRTAEEEFGEFEGNHDEQEQLRALRRTGGLAKEKLGLHLSVWGPHWSGTNEHTDRALAQMPQILMTFGYPPAVEHYQGFVFRNTINIEYPTHNPDFEAFKKSYEERKNRFDYFYMQGHPDSWDETRWENFVKIIEFLETENVQFITPSEVLEELASRKDSGVKTEADKP